MERWWNDTDRVSAMHSALNISQGHFDHGTVFAWSDALLSAATNANLSVGLFFLSTGLVPFNNGRQFTIFSPDDTTCKERKWSRKCLKWVCFVLFVFSAKILLHAETALSFC
jgi:hypothetical protein